MGCKCCDRALVGQGRVTIWAEGERVFAEAKGATVYGGSIEEALGRMGVVADDTPRSSAVLGTLARAWDAFCEACEDPVLRHDFIHAIHAAQMIEQSRLIESRGADLELLADWLEAGELDEPNRLYAAGMLRAMRLESR